MLSDKDINIESTADGSVTLYLPELDEHYHSVKGALTESCHVYVDLGWRKAATEKSTEGLIRVFEAGYGTGLNSALTALEAMKEQRPTIYYSVELYPLPASLYTTVAEQYPPYLATAMNAVNSAQWNEEISINPYFTLKKINADLLTVNVPEGIDVVYFDAFAPEKQPTLWEEPIFSRIYDAMNPDGVLATYCAKGCIRRLLQSIGFLTERLPGPPGGKREVLRATKP
ncbi:MAG: tRNA (5-methylaminomethyl-2-thiouridine)(34)-methyltransferase MnmD [Bacteroidales bacterium]|nr:tRNA (5-methylaminomethyl-2-thiouridine)(34)-methyltransferase MnmD [Bacteroidales bacterium]